MSALIVAASAPFALAARSRLARQLARSTRNASRGFFGVAATTAFAIPASAESTASALLGVWS
jgi:hypothetical protein